MRTMDSYESQKLDPILDLYTPTPSSSHHPSVSPRPFASFSQLKRHASTCGWRKVYAKAACSVPKSSMALAETCSFRVNDFEQAAIVTLALEIGSVL